MRPKAIHTARPLLVLHVTCPVCKGSTCNPEAPAELAGDVRTCLLCCDPSRATWATPGTIDAAPIWRTLELVSLDAACAFGLSWRQVLQLRHELLGAAARAGLSLSGLLDRLLLGHARPPRGTFSDRELANVEACLSSRRLH